MLIKHLLEKHALLNNWLKKVIYFFKNQHIIFNNNNDDDDYDDNNNNNNKSTKFILIEMRKNFKFIPFSFYPEKGEETRP